jgi:predicted sulfurtransferase
MEWDNPPSNFIKLAGTDAMKCKFCKNPREHHVRLTTPESKAEIRFYCCSDCREPVMEELKKRQQKVIVNPRKRPTAGKRSRKSKD